MTHSRLPTYTLTMEAELSDEQTGLVAAFSELTGADSETASHVLEAHGWDLNAGVDFFLENGARPAVPPPAPLEPEAVEDADEPIVIDSEEERDAALARRLAGALFIHMPASLPSHSCAAAVPKEDSATESEHPEDCAMCSASLQRSRRDWACRYCNGGSSRPLLPFSNLPLSSRLSRIPRLEVINSRQPNPPPSWLLPIAAPYLLASHIPPLLVPAARATGDGDGDGFSTRGRRLSRLPTNGRSRYRLMARELFHILLLLLIIIISSSNSSSTPKAFTQSF